MINRTVAFNIRRIKQFHQVKSGLSQDGPFVRKSFETVMSVIISEPTFSNAAEWEKRTAEMN